VIHRPRAAQERRAEVRPITDFRRDFGVARPESRVAGGDVGAIITLQSRRDHDDITGGRPDLDLQLRVPGRGDPDR
jgi:hypothetical protein